MGGRHGTIWFVFDHMASTQNAFGAWFLKTFQMLDDGKIRAQSMQEPMFIDQSVIWDIM